MPCKNASAIIDTSIQLVWNFAERLLGAQGSFLEK